MLQELSHLMKYEITVTALGKYNSRSLGRLGIPMVLILMNLLLKSGFVTQIKFLFNNCSCLD